MPELTNDTDHYGFSVRGVPSIHYGVGGSREDYHTVRDSTRRVRRGTHRFDDRRAEGHRGRDRSCRGNRRHARR
jgi:hypothetical protein